MFVQPIHVIYLTGSYIALVWSFAQPQAVNSWSLMVIVN